MRGKLKWRYWCDWCKKARNSKAAMVLHENRCTLNPERECGVCRSEKLSPQPLAYLKAVARNDPAELATLDADDEMGGRLQIATAQGLVDELMDLADGCPACVFAALRQTGRLAYQEEKEPFSMVSFRYQHEMQEFWERRRDDDDYRDMMANCY